MSRIGKRILEIPNGVSVEMQGDKFFVTGKLGSMHVDIPEDLHVQSKNNAVHVIPNGDITPMWGTINALIANAIYGVSTGFVTKLKLVGVGYRVALSGQSMNFKLAYSHDIKLDIPQGISVNIPSPTMIEMQSIDKCMLFSFAAKIKSLKKYDPYKGKGIFYENEKLLRKECKKK